ncbi:NrtA/SsuA/CpmA family ABC transporter substrate-binding protein [Bacillus sp. FJAT-29790]|uniref:taurine ABC transporter substrate-binding protein n=1 Tax=Bacillus sp. FJAT-29790 TaxID=1895002 RepID=UPI001C23CAB0|nr:NrtA/SsuA/CpmA family ABC transporter substrate-binding protein [Bacillus sp. FJAT-29790]MBU8878604.1 NrtA/SsuA/CpmA family ABC transporter substrate-binding protein [Bacillus sp. FJAT-29790]
MKKYRFISIWIILLLGFGSLVGCTSNETVSSKEENNQNHTVKIGWQPSVEVPFYVAQKEKLFEKNSLQPEYTKFTAGPPMFAAFNSGSIDVAYMGNPPAVIAMAENLPVSIIGVEVESSGGEALVVNANSGINKLEDIKGKRISVLRGSSAEYAMMHGLKQVGLKPDELTILDLDITTIIPAFMKGDVDGVWVWDPWASKLVTAGGKVVVRDKEIGIGACGVWMAHNDWIEKNPEAVQAFLKGLSDANEIIHNDKEKSVKILQEALALEKQEAESVITNSAFPTLQKMWETDYQFSMNPQAINQNEGLAKVLNKLAEFLKERDKISQLPNVNQHINGSFVEKLQN